MYECCHSGSEMKLNFKASHRVGKRLSLKIVEKDVHCKLLTNLPDNHDLHCGIELVMGELGVEEFHST